MESFRSRSGGERGLEGQYGKREGVGSGASSLHSFSMWRLKIVWMTLVIHGEIEALLLLFLSLTPYSSPL